MTAARHPGTARVRTPATCANLGPGFDTLGLALALYDEVTVRVTRGGVAVRVAGEGAGELPTGADHLVVRAMYAAFDTLAATPPPGLDLTCVNRIPQARGLGSSSSAIVGGILLARALLPEGGVQLDEAAVLRLAAEIEGHPDNVAPCLLGGLTIAWTQAGGASAVRMDPHPAVRPVVFIPEERGLTTAARAALPELVPHSDAAANTGRAALLVHALTSDPSYLLPATEDRLHQRYRAPGMPESAALVEKLRAEGAPAVISGAGPSVLVLASDTWVPPQLAGWRVLSLPVDETGAASLDTPAILGHAEQDVVAASPAS